MDQTSFGFEKKNELIDGACQMIDDYYDKSKFASAS